MKIKKTEYSYSKSEVSFYAKGRFSEDCLQKYLKQRGFKSLGQRIICFGVEVDLLMIKDNKKFIFEVKSVPNLKQDLSLVVKKKQYKRLLFVFKNFLNLGETVEMVYVMVDPMEQFKFFPRAQEWIEF